jgi:hypothetical protein
MEPLTGRGWMAQREGTTIILYLRGDWTTREEGDGAVVSSMANAVGQLADSIASAVKGL